MSLCTWVEGPGGRADLGVLRPPPGLIAPRLWCTAEQRDESVKTMSVPSSRSRAPSQAWMSPQGMPALRHRAPQEGRFFWGGCRTGSPIEIGMAWRRGPGRPGPCSLRAARCALCAVDSSALCAALCVVLCARWCCALCVVLCCALCAAISAVRAAPCGALCAASCGAPCAASGGALCAASCTALCAASCGALCAASCGALCAVLCAGTACALPWCCALCAAHCAASAPWCYALSTVPCAPAPTPASPACLVCPVGRGGGVSGAQWGRIRPPPCVSRAAEMLQKTSCSPGAAGPCGEGGGVICSCRFPCRQHKHKGICGISKRAHSYCPGALLECASPKLYPSSQRASPPNNSDRAGGDGRATHRLEKPGTKQQRSLKLSKENNSSARAKLSFPMPATKAQRNLRDQPAVYIANPPSLIATPPCAHRGKTRTADGVGQPPHRALTRNSGTPRTYKVRPHSQPEQDPRSEKKVHPNPPGGPAAAG